MEIHPHPAPHSVKDFLLQIGTITIGILIALSAEALVEWNHHRTLVHEAQENLTQEIKDNQVKLDRAVQGLAQGSKSLDHALRFADERLKNAQASGSLEVRYSLAELQDAAWATSQASGALTHMPYRDVQRYAQVYSLQREFGRQENEVVQGLVAVTPAFDMETASRAEVLGWKRALLGMRSQLTLAHSFASALRQRYAEAMKSH